MDTPRAEQDETFDHSRECFGETLGWLEGPDAAALSHAELEASLK